VINCDVPQGDKVSRAFGIVWSFGHYCCQNHGAFYYTLRLLVKNEENTSDQYPGKVLDSYTAISICMPMTLDMYTSNLGMI